MSGFSLSKEDIDPSDYSEEELRDLIFNAAVCGKVVERLSQDEFSLRAAYDIISEIDELPHERRPSDLLLEKALRE
jgi:hypothetical protein